MYNDLFTQPFRMLDFPLSVVITMDISCFAEETLFEKSLRMNIDHNSLFCTKGASKI